jgi:hypothetical protein
MTTHRNRLGPLGTRLMMIFVGAVFLGIGIWQYLDQSDFESKAVKTTGTVINVKRETRTSTNNNRRTTSTVYRPVIRFEDEGRTYTFTSSSASSGYNFSRGRRVEILYDRINPIDARMDDAVFSLLPFIFIGVGGFILFAGLFLRVVIKGKGESKPSA